MEDIPGSVGDPILVDFAGHRFMGGSRDHTDYLLYRSHDETEAITMTTGAFQGLEDGFFAVAVGVQHAGCGSLRIAAGLEHTAEISGDACMTARIARGDEGLVLVPIGEGGDAGSVLAVYPHQQGDSPAFLNMRLLATTAEFRAGCTGMLCDEGHGDVEA